MPNGNGSWDLAARKRLASIQRAGQCISCQKPLRVGESALWHPTNKTLLCLGCATPSGSGTNRTAPVDASLERPTTSISGGGDRQGEWSRYVGYLIDCVEQDGRLDTKQLTAPGVFNVPSLTRESTLRSGAPIDLGIPPPPSDHTLLYGWPTLALRRDAGPLLRLPAVAVSMRIATTGGTYFVDDADIALNPVLLNSNFLPPEVVDELRAFDESIDPERIPAVVAEVARILDLPTVRLDPDHLQQIVPGTAGVHNCASLLAVPSTTFTTSLLRELKELRDIADWPGTAAALVMGTFDRKSARIATSAVEALPLNEAQREAVAAVHAGVNLVLTGPPGTGKTQVVSALAADAWAAGCSILVVSTNNAAVDNAVSKTSELVADGVLIRTGSKEIRDEVPLRVSALRERAQEAYLAGVAHASANGLLPDTAQTLAARRSQAVNVRSLLDSRLAAIDRSEAEYLERIGPQRDLEQGLWAGAAPSDERLCGELTVRCERTLRARMFRGWRLRSLQRRLQALGGTAAINAERFMAWRAGDRRIRELAQFLETEREAVLPAELAIVAADRAVQDASLSYVRFIVGDGLRTSPPHQPHPIEIVRAQVAGNFRQALRASLPSLRGWATTSLSMAGSLPLSPGLFDLVVIDEATQCTTASALPALYRARRAVVIGDPNQLLPVVQLRPKEHNKALEQAGLQRDDVEASERGYLESSVWHAVQASLGRDRTLTLDLHYRCHPTIARWFNRTFYGDSLVVATDLDQVGVGERGMSWIDADGPAERPAGGSLRNAVQAEIVAMHVCRLVDEGESSIGVVTPFAAQVRLICDVLDRIDPSLRQFVTVATAHRFQGGERNVIVFSTVIDPATSPGTAKWLEGNRNLINVAASRARRLLVVIGHPGLPSMNLTPTLSSLRSAAIHGLEPPRQATNLHSEFEEVVFGLLERAGFRPQLKPIVEGYELDIAVVVADCSVDVEVDGIHHLDRRGQSRRRDIARDAALRSIGWRVVRIPTWRIAMDGQGAVDEAIRGIR